MTFELNGRGYTTDSETLDLLREYRSAGNNDMFGTVFELGLAFGRITALEAA